MRCCAGLGRADPLGLQCLRYTVAMVSAMQGEPGQ